MWSLIFPGQGSQHVGMGKFLCDNFPIARETFEEASDHLKINFNKMCFEGDESELALTKNTQPALLLVSVASYRVLKYLVEFEVTATAGHSVGEYAAMVAAEVLRFPDALMSVRQRGAFMQSAVPLGEGGMVAVMGPNPKQTIQLCQWAEKESGMRPLEPANFNAPGQIVVSGSQRLIEWLKMNIKPEEIFENPPKKLRLIPLNVSAPFHCSMMKPAEDSMRLILEKIDFATAKFPVVQNVPAEAVTETLALRENLIRQISLPVRWIECVERLRQLGVTQCIECGPGQVLKGLVKKIDSEHLTTFNMNSLEEVKTLEKELQNASA